MLCRTTQHIWIMVESFNKMWSTREGNRKTLQYSCLENRLNSMKRQKDLTLKDELPRSVGTKYATAEEQRKNFIRNKQAEPKQKHHPVWMCLVVEVKSDALKNNTA